MGSKDKYQRLGDGYHWGPGWIGGSYGQWVRRVLGYLPERGTLENHTDGGGGIRFSVLDVGCGDGYPASRLVARGYQVWGVDELRGPREGARQKVPVGATCSSNWPSVAADFVLALDSLEHMADPGERVSAAQRCHEFALISCPLPGMDPDAERDYDAAAITALFVGCEVEHLIDEGEHQLYKVTPFRPQYAEGGHVIDEKPVSIEDKPAKPVTKKRGRGRPRITPEDRGQEPLSFGETA